VYWGEGGYGGWVFRASRSKSPDAEVLPKNSSQFCYAALRKVMITITTSTQTTITSGRDLSRYIIKRTIKLYTFIYFLSSRRVVDANSSMSEKEGGKTKNAKSARVYRNDRMCLSTSDEPFNEVSDNY
jgi:hypothetical protein